MSTNNGTTLADLLEEELLELTGKSIKNLKPPIGTVVVNSGILLSAIEKNSSINHIKWDCLSDKELPGNSKYSLIAQELSEEDRLINFVEKKSNGDAGQAFFEKLVSRLDNKGRLLIIGSYDPTSKKVRSNPVLAVTEYLTNCWNLKTPPPRLLKLKSSKVQIANESTHLFLLTFTILTSYPKSQAHSEIETVFGECSRIIGDRLAKMRNTDSEDDYYKVLVELLSGCDNGLLPKMSNALSHNVMSVDSDVTWIEFWVAYESIKLYKGSPRRIPSDIKAFTEDLLPDNNEMSNDFPLFGFGYDLPQNLNDFFHNHKKKLKPAANTLARIWLNIILHSPFEYTGIDNSGDTFSPKAVHDWFMSHVGYWKSNEAIETLTVYIPTQENINKAVQVMASSTQRHKRIELKSFEKAEDGKLWGVQLAQGLLDISETLRPENNLTPWPYEKDEYNEKLKRIEGKPSDLIFYMFNKETEDLKVAQEKNEKIKPSKGWLRINLYSICLCGILHNELPEDESWVKFYLSVLNSEIGCLKDLAETIERSFTATKSFRNKNPVTSLCWIAPPTFSTEDDQVKLGSSLVLSSEILKPGSIRWIQPLLHTVLSSVRQGEDIVKNETIKLTEGKLKGLKNADENFRHEIAKFSSLMLHRLRPMRNFFKINSRWDPDRRSTFKIYKAEAGNLTINDHYTDYSNTVSSWYVCDTPSLINSIVNQLNLWSSPKEWLKEKGIRKGIHLKEVIKKMVQIGVEAGEWRVQKSNIVPTNIKTAATIDATIQNKFNKMNIVDDQVKIEKQIIWNRSPEQISDEDIWFFRMLLAGIANSVEYQIEDDKNFCVKLKYDAANKFIIVEIENTYIADQSSNKSKNKTTTKNVLEDGLAHFDVTPEYGKNVWFGPKKESNDIWLTMFSIPITKMEMSFLEENR